MEEALIPVQRNCSIEGGKEEEIKEGDDASGWKELGRFYLFFLLCFQLFITVEHSHKATTIQTKIYRDALIPPIFIHKGIVF